MMAKQETTNLFGSFDLAAAERQQEQERIEARVTGQAAPPKPKQKERAVPLGRPRKRLDATSMTISISQADKDLVKAYAFRHALTVSDLIHMWISEHCVEE